MGERELDRRRLERDSVAVADGLERERPLEPDLVDGRVVERSAGPRVGEQPAVVDAAGDDRDAALGAQRKQLGERVVIEQRVAAGEQEAVEIGRAREASEHRRLVHAGSDRANRALVPQTLERAERDAGRLVVVLVGVVDVQHVDAVEREPLEALGDRAKHALLAEVEDRIDIRRAVVVAHRIGVRQLAEQPPDLRRDHDFVARQGRQTTTETRLREPVPVLRRGVEKAHSGVDGLGDRGGRSLVRDRLVEPADRSRPETEPRHLEPARAEGHTLGRIESHRQPPTNASAWVTRVLREGS